MTIEKYEKIKQKTFNDALMSGLEVFITITYLIIFLVMIKIFTVIPAIATTAILAWFIYKFVTNLKIYGKVKKYENKLNEA